MTSRWGEGCVSTMADMRVEASSTKPHGEELRLTPESHQPPLHRSSIVKRSYRRALQRINRHGYTWYRGQLLSGPVTPNLSSSLPRPKHSHNIYCPWIQTQKEVDMLHLECGRHEYSRLGPLSRVANRAIPGRTGAPGDALGLHYRVGTGPLLLCSQWSSITNEQG